MAADEAKQLDSVTDRIADKESMDANKATAAMSSLNAKKVDGLKDDLSAIQVSKEDIDLIVDELEVTDDEAEKALKCVKAEGLVNDDKLAVGEALRRLVSGL